MSCLVRGIFYKGDFIDYEKDFYDSFRCTFVSGRKFVHNQL